MQCPHCDFIFKGQVKKCPRCGEPISGPEHPLDKQVNLLGWFYISVRSLILLISLNIFLIILVTEIILNYAGGVNYHISPWAFLGIFLAQYIVHCFTKKGNEFYYLFTVTAVFVGLLFFSYHETYNETIPTISLVMYYILPIYALVNLILTIAHQVKYRYYFILGVCMSSLLSIFVSSLSFGLSFANGIRLVEGHEVHIIITSIIFVTTVVVAVQMIFLAFLRLRSKMNFDATN